MARIDYFRKWLTGSSKINRYSKVHFCRPAHISYDISLVSTTTMQVVSIHHRLHSAFVGGILSSCLSNSIPSKAILIMQLNQVMIKVSSNKDKFYLVKYRNIDLNLSCSISYSDYLVGDTK
jgi:hypothetical protein